MHLLSPNTGIYVHTLLLLAFPIQLSLFDIRHYLFIDCKACTVFMYGNHMDIVIKGPAFGLHVALSASHESRGARQIAISVVI